MTQAANPRRSMPDQRRSDSLAQPGFKPVALPALAAAIQAARMQPRERKPSDLPAILRKETTLG
jgi:hypothetical protein